MTINVTKPFLPDLAEYNFFLEGIWKRNWITNHGPLVCELEQKLQSFLNSPPLLYLNNGTVALQIAIKALDLRGEVITTPFSYVATTSSLLWEGCKPVFVDINPETFNIDHTKIEAAITTNTTGILATHVFGNPCDVHSIKAIADKYNLKVVYDAAHAFGVEINGDSLFQYGDISTVSFHATKIFHTGEGGGVFTKDENLYRKIQLLRNFGHLSPIEFSLAGINGKASELHAAMGLSVLPYMDEIILGRKVVSETYSNAFMGSTIVTQKIAPFTKYNYAYYPVVLNDEKQINVVLEALNSEFIFPRRYFYPSLDTIEFVKSNEVCAVSRNIASRILCLPIYHDLSTSDITKICNIILSKV
jgi:dTDP-4-amino-4,6-dideoxygalactose transaminase